MAELFEQIRLATQALAEFGAHLFNPTVRLGVTGLSNADKTVFTVANRLYVTSVKFFDRYSL